MIIDVHTHIFPPQVRHSREKYAVGHETAFQSIYANPKARMAGVSDLLQAMDDDGVDMAVTFGFPWVSRETAMRHNDYVLESQSKHPGRIVGLACFDPLQPWAEKEAERALDAGLRGLGELAVYSAGFDQEAIRRLAALGSLCRERHVPIMVHVNEPVGHQYPGKAPLTLKMIYDLVLAVPGVPLILAHWGGGLFFFDLLKKEVHEALENVYFDTAASPFLYRPQVYDLASRIIGPEKILFGSDYPLLRPDRYFRDIDAAGLDSRCREAITGGSAAGVFNI